jgi:hypothetical protein
MDFKGKDPDLIWLGTIELAGGMSKLKKEHGVR